MASQLPGMGQGFRLGQTNMSGEIDWTDAFDNGGYIEGAADYPPLWARSAAAFRETLEPTPCARLDLRYGDHERERFDLFLPQDEPAGLLVFVHGGYWLKFDKSTWSHLAAGSLSRGWAVAMPSYPLAPEARVSEITRSVARAVTEAAAHVSGPIRLAGHSAGGHLVCRMLCAGVLPDSVAKRLAGAVSISGLHQLRPLVAAAMNEKLRLTPEEAHAESPACLEPSHGVPLIAWVGAKERPEFLRQTRLIEEVWCRTGADVVAHYDPGHHHFSVIAALAEPDTSLTHAVLTGALPAPAR